MNSHVDSTVGIQISNNQEHVLIHKREPFHFISIDWSLTCRSPKQVDQWITFWVDHPIQYLWWSSLSNYFQPKLLTIASLTWVGLWNRSQIHNPGYTFRWLLPSWSYICCSFISSLEMVRGRFRELLWLNRSSVAQTFSRSWIRTWTWLLTFKLAIVKNTCWSINVGSSSFSAYTGHWLRARVNTIGTGVNHFSGWLSKSSSVLDFLVELHSTQD